MKIRAQYNGKTQLVIPIFMDEEVTSWVQRLRPLETQEVDMRALNLHNPMYKKLKMKVDRLEKELEARMDQNSLTVSKVFKFSRIRILNFENLLSASFFCRNYRDKRAFSNQGKFYEKKIRQELTVGFLQTNNRSLPI